MEAGLWNFRKERKICLSKLPFVLKIEQLDNRLHISPPPCLFETTSSQTEMGSTTITTITMVTEGAVEVRILEEQVTMLVCRAPIMTFAFKVSNEIDVDKMG